MTAPPRITILCTGDMGSAFARVYAARGRAVTAWNRTRAKAERLAEHGVQVAGSIEDAVERGDIILALPKPFAALDGHLRAAGLGPRLSGKLLVVMSSVRSLEEPRAMARWAAEHDIEYLDGKVLAFPGQIGTPEAPLVYCGDAEAFSRARDSLALLGQTTYLGAPITHGAVLEASAVSFYPAVCASFFNGLAMCEAMGFPRSAYAHSCFAMLSGLQQYLSTVVDVMVPQGDFDPARHQTSPIESWIQVEHFANVYREAGVEPRLLEPVVPMMKAEIAAGRGTLDLAALIERFTPPR